MSTTNKAIKDIYDELDIGRETFVENARFFEKVKPEALFLVTEIPDPRNYGVLEEYEFEDKGVYRVYKVVEKPETPKTNFVIVPVYIFTPKIFEVLKKVKPGIGGDIQLTDAIGMIAKDRRVYAMKLKNGEDYIDIGNPENCLKALEKSFRLGQQSHDV